MAALGENTSGGGIDISTEEYTGDAPDKGGGVSGMFKDDGTFVQKPHRPKVRVHGGDPRDVDMTQDS